jgi:hypothetical protein
MRRRLQRSCCEPQRACATARRPNNLRNVAVSEPGDRQERDAARMADRILTGQGPLVQREVVAGSPSAPSVPVNIGLTGGAPLGAATRGFMEAQFGHRFDDVRVHTDARAGQAARSFRARAFTIGRHIAFEPGRYAPHSAQGRRLLAHELAHVVQQRGAPSDGVTRVQRSTDETHCGGGGCADPNGCATPDREGTGQASGWTMVVNIDTERGSFYDALLHQEFGHTYVRLLDSTGTAWSYGFYPARTLPNENRPEVEGCVHHPDNTHASCTDEQVMYTLSQPQYNAALTRAQELCRAPRAYHAANFNCATFAGDLVRTAGQSLPSMRGTETIFSQHITADNPNTLIENVRAERTRAPRDRFPFWNNRCLNDCEANFESCLGNSRSGPLPCIGTRDYCLRRCPPPQ